MTPPPPPDAAVAVLPSHSAIQRIRARGRVRGALPLLGPAFVAAVAYVDPGNFATNVQAGAGHGYLLLWVVLTANLMAMLVQYLSAKLGVATDKNLAELCRERFARPVTWGLWIQAEVMAMATDLAEFVGAAIALNLLFGLPLLTAGLATAAAAFILLALQRRGYRRFEVAIAGLLAVVLLGFLYEARHINGPFADVAMGFVPHFDGNDSVLLATGIIGATVMPHVIYLHSALTQRRLPLSDEGERRLVMRFQGIDVTIAMTLAGLVNLIMLAVMASVFHGTGHEGVNSIEQAHSGLTSVVGPGAAFAFALALLASGMAAASVGTYAGQVVMQGFLRRAIPLVVRRAITMAPALLILAVGVEPTRALVMSQVVLSFGIPAALVPLVLLTRQRDVMGTLVNRPQTTVAAALVATIIITLNGLLIVESIWG